MSRGSSKCAQVALAAIRDDVGASVDLEEKAPETAVPRVLLAEDNVVLRKGMSDTLEEAGWHVVACAEGASALRALEREVFDLVLSDVHMPGASGFDLLHRAQELRSGMSVVLMTGSADPEEAAMAARDGARDYIAKPFDMDKLVECLGRLCPVRTAP